MAAGFLMQPAMPAPPAACAYLKRKMLGDSRDCSQSAHGAAICRISHRCTYMLLFHAVMQANRSCAISWVLHSNASVSYCAGLLKHMCRAQA
jgi:hypothetical protein